MATVSMASKALERWLEAHCVTQADLAARLAKHTRTKLQQGTVSSWIAGRHIPRGQYMAALLECCDIAINDWMKPVRTRLARTGTDG